MPIWTSKSMFWKMVTKKIRSNPHRYFEYFWVPNAFWSFWGIPVTDHKKVPFGLIKSELLWFLKGGTNIRFLLQHKNHIWDEWPFQNYVQSADYQGPDMTDFSHRALKDPEFNKVYKEQMNLFCQKKFLTMKTLPTNTAILAWFMGVNGVLGRLRRAKPLIKFKTWLIWSRIILIPEEWLFPPGIQRTCLQWLYPLVIQCSSFMSLMAN